jgi:hypothetical protein
VVRSFPLSCVRVLSSSLYVPRLQVSSNILTCSRSLITNLHDQGRRKESEELEVQVVEVRKRTLGQEHSDTLASISNLALTY